MSKDAYWFHHDSNALQDPKVARLLRLHGLEGYGLFWAVIERLREAPDHLIECDSIPDICFQLRAKEEIFNSLFECQLLQKNDADSFFSESLIRRMERWNAKRETLRANGRKGGVAKAKQKGGKCLANAKQMPSKTLAIRSEKIREDEIREDEIKTLLPAEADASPVATADLAIVPRKLPVKKERTPKGEGKSVATWEAYSAAYENRYGEKPIRNQKNNIHCCQLVDRIGAEEAPHVAAWYVQSNSYQYVQSGHALSLLVRDAEKLRTEWITGRTITRQAAMDAERRQSNGDVWRSVMEKHGDDSPEGKIDYAKMFNFENSGNVRDDNGQGNQ
jgi:hypothetical protein